MEIPTNLTGAENLGWLAEVQEARYPISNRHPIRMRHGTIRSGPPMSSPQRHPFCEISMLIEGRGVEFVEGEEAEIQGGDIFVCGPDVPHLHRITKYPHRFATAYFLPSVFIGPGAESDGLRVLQRVMAHQPLSRRLIRPSPGLRRKIDGYLSRMIVESESSEFGGPFYLKSLLFQIFVELIRFEAAVHGTSIQTRSASEIDLKPLDGALRYIHSHFDQPIYAKELAAAAGLGESALKVLFREALRMTWVQYLQHYRIRRASLLLGAKSHNVTEACMAVGFESLSHFNATFSRIMGVSPKHFARS
jgi:AraC-like DNA-binding protein